MTTQRTPLINREFPDYTRAEEVFNMVTHIVGAACAIAIAALCIIFSALHHNAWGVVSSAIYGGSMICVFCISSIYHGLNKNIGKQVMRIIDHCDIYFLIAGTYTPIMLAGVRLINPVIAWVVFGIEWGCAVCGVILNAIDLKKFKVFSLILYLIMGWTIVFCVKTSIQAMTLRGFLWILYGGISFTVGALLYVIGKKNHRYFHSIFHIFVVFGCVLQFFGIFFYIL